MATDLRDSWQDVEHDVVADALCARAREIETDLAGRYTAVRRAYCLYGDAAQLGVKRRPGGFQLCRNVIPEAIDALAAQLVQGPIRAQIVGTALDWELREKAKWWTWYSDAAFLRHRMSYLAHQVGRDALIAGLGLVVVVDTDKGPRPERIHPMDALIDDAGCIESEPPELVIKRRVSRHRLAKQYPDFADEILSAPRMPEALGKEVLEVYEGWFEDRRHVIAVRGVREAILDDEDWEGRPPWAYVRLVPPTSGFWGESLVLRAGPLQIECNKIEGRIRDEMHFNRNRLFIQAGAVNTKHLDNEAGGFVECKVPPATAVQPVAMASVNTEFWKRLDDLYKAIFVACQANQLFAAGEHPANLQSGKAMIVHREIQSRRHLPMLRELDDFYRLTTEELIRGELRAHKANKTHRVIVRVSGVLKDLAVAQMKIDLESIQVQVMLSSELPLEPSGRIELLAELAKDNLLTPEGFHAASNIPDFERARLQATAPTELIEAQLDRMLDDGKFRAPYKYMDLALAMRTGVRVLQRAELDGAPADRLNLLRKWIDRVAGYLDELKAASAPPPAAPPMPPMPPDGMPPSPPAPPDGGGLPLPTGAPPGAGPEPLPLPQAA